MNTNTLGGNVWCEEYEDSIIIHVENQTCSFSLGVSKVEALAIVNDILSKIDSTNVAMTIKGFKPVQLDMEFRLKPEG